MASFGVGGRGFVALLRVSRLVVEDAVDEVLCFQALGSGNAHLLGNGHELHVGFGFQFCLAIHVVMQLVEMMVCLSFFVGILRGLTSGRPFLSNGFLTDLQREIDFSASRLSVF